MVSHSKTTTNSNKTKWISTSPQNFKTKSNKRLKQIDTFINHGVKYTYFVASKLIRVAF